MRVEILKVVTALFALCVAASVVQAKEKTSTSRNGRAIGSTGA